MRPNLAVHRQTRPRIGMSHVQIRSRVLTSVTDVRSRPRGQLRRSVNVGPNQPHVQLRISHAPNLSHGVSRHRKPGLNGTSRREMNAPMKYGAKTRGNLTTLVSLDGQTSRTTNRTKSHRHLRPMTIVRTKC